MEQFKKNRDEVCCGNGDSKRMTEAAKEKNIEAKVKMLGGGCAKCQALEKATKEALIQLGMDETIEHVTDFNQIAAYGVMSTPALVFEGKVLSYGKVLKTKEIIKLLQNQQ